MDCFRVRADARVGEISVHFVQEERCCCNFAKNRSKLTLLGPAFTVKMSVMV